MDVNSKIKLLGQIKGIVYFLNPIVCLVLVILTDNILYFFITFFFTWLIAYIIIPFFENKLKK